MPDPTPLTDDEQIALLIARGMSEAEAREYLATARHNAGLVTAEEREARLAELRAELEAEES